MRFLAASGSLFLLLAACVGDAATPSSSSSSGGAANDAAPGVDADAPKDGGTTQDATADAGPPPIAPPLVGPKVWLDARKVPAATPATKTWKDESGNGNDATGGVALSVEPAMINGRPAMYLPGEQAQALQVAATAFDFNVSPGFVVAIVAKTKMPAAARTAQAVLFDRTKTTGVFPGVLRYGSAMYLDSALTKNSAFAYTTLSSNQVTTTAELTTDVFAPHVYVYRIANAKIDTWVDGKSNVGAATVAANDFSTANSAPLALFGYVTTDNAQFTYNGHVGEVLVYNRTVSDAEVATLTTKLRGEWGIP